MTLRFADCELDDATRVLRRAGTEVPVQPKVMDLLLYLVWNRERVVAREAIHRALWPDTAVTEASLARLVKEMRRAIGDDGRRQALVRTVHGRGYCFVAAVEEREPAGRGEAVYVGRAGLLGQIDAALENALAGRGRIVLLAGEPGVGKTRTAEELAERARLRGCEVATAWASEEDGSPALWAWVQILRALVDARSEDDLPRALGASASELARLVPSIRDRIDGLPRPSSGNHESARFRLFDSVQAFLARVARDRPIALVLDDLHWADADSLLLLDYVSHEIQSLPILVAGTYREAEIQRHSRRAGALAQLSTRAAVERHRLSGLSPAEVERFVALRLAAAPPALTRVLADKTEGNPFFLQEILRFLAADDSGAGTFAPDTDWETLVPQGVQQVVGERLGQLSGATHRVLRCAAAIGREFAGELLVRSSGEPQADVDAALSEAQRARVLVEQPRAPGRLRFSHALFRDALYAELAAEPGGRNLQHGRIGAALEDLLGERAEARLAELAHHFSESLPGGDAGRAIDYCVRAGDVARSVQAYEDASEHYQRALRAVELQRNEDARLRCDLLLSLGEAQRRSLGLETARSVFLRAAAVARECRAPDRLARAALAYGDRPDAVTLGDRAVLELLEEASTALGDGSGGLRTRVSSRLGVELRYDDPAQARALVEGAVRDARQRGDPGALAQSLDDLSFITWSPADPEAWIELNGEIVRAATEAGEHELALAGHGGRLSGFLEIGALGDLDRELERTRQLASELRTPFLRWLIGMADAMRAFLEGRFREGERLVQQHAEDGLRTEHPDVIAQLGSQTFYLHLERGRLADLEPSVRDSVRRFPHVRAWRCGLARLLVEEGRYEEARAELADLAASDFADLPADRNWMVCTTLLAEVSAALGDADCSAKLYELLSPFERLNVVVGHGGLCYGSVARYLGVLASSLSRFQTAARHFEHALAAHERMGAHPMSAHTRYDYARMLLTRGDRGDRDRALALLSEAGDAAAKLDMFALLEKTEAARRAAGASGEDSRAARSPAAR